MNKKKTTLVAALVVMGVAVLGLAAAVYAKYVLTFASGSNSLTVAKWAFESDNSNGAVGCRLDKTYNASTLVNGKIAPGTSGSCTLELKNINTEVGVNYSISLDSVANQPQHLKIYKDSAHTQELTAADPVTGTLAPKAGAQDVVVYWYWPYMSSAASARGTVHNKRNGGVITILGGVIISSARQGVDNERGTLVIGQADGAINNTAPVIRGTTYGVTTTANISVYDGVLMGVNGAIDNTLYYTK